MKKYILGGAALLALVIVVAVVMGTHTSDNSSSTAPKTTSADTSNAVATNAVTIKNYMFDPSPITVKVGTTVTWTNTDAVKHTVTSDPGTPAAFTSELFGEGQTYSYTFTKAGTYTYFCKPHTYMHGTVAVTN